MQLTEGHSGEHMSQWQPLQNNRTRLFKAGERVFPLQPLTVKCESSVVSSPSCSAFLRNIVWGLWLLQSCFLVIREQTKMHILPVFSSRFLKPQTLILYHILTISAQHGQRKKRQCSFIFVWKKTIFYCSTVFSFHYGFFFELTFNLQWTFWFIYIMIRTKAFSLRKCHLKQ